MIVPNSDQIADRLESLRPGEMDPVAVARVVGLVRGCARDAEDEALLLDALGLNGRRVRVNFSDGGLLSRGPR